MNKPYDIHPLSDEEAIDMVQTIYDFEVDHLDKTEDKYLFYDKDGQVIEFTKEEILGE